MASNLSTDLSNLESHLLQVHLGDNDAIEQILGSIIAGGHCLIQGAPGLGKTRLLRELARCLSLDFQRIQGTPDLMPSDITGSEIFNQQSSTFEFEPGPIFAQLCMFDELNRATPRSQAALLQALEESTVSAGRITHHLPQPFFVAATQNPIEIEGTFPLPEAQLDRFMVRIDFKQPSTECLSKILQLDSKPVDDAPLLTAAQLIDAQQQVVAVAVADDLFLQTAKLISNTHQHDDVQLGASPRGGQAIIRFAKALAYLRKRQHVAPQDLNDAVIPCLRHRLILGYQANAQQLTSDDILRDILARTPIS
ncbi:MAG: AAA family ATPase [Planctomycetes bacterium]|nr:AAA family ATPase [Planctomycetota bacterium]